MLGFVILGFLAAFGAFCALWAFLGWWLMESYDDPIVLFPASGREEAALRPYLWLRNLGIVKGKLTVVSDTVFSLADRYPSVEFLTWAEYLTHLEREREKLYGT